MSVQERALEILRESGAVLTDDHFVYTSGNHGRDYVNKDAVYVNPRRISALCRMMTLFFGNDEIEVVVGPEKGGIILSQWTAYHLNISSMPDVSAVYAEKQPDGTFALTRGYGEYVKGRRTLIVEDVLTTGGSVRKVVEALSKLTPQPEIVGIAALCNRGGVKPEDIGVPDIRALVNLRLENWPASDCPLCRDQVPINTVVGKGREFMASLSR